MNRRSSGRLTGGFLPLLVLAAIGGAPISASAQGTPSSSPASYVARAATTADRVSANVARAEAVTDSVPPTDGETVGAAVDSTPVAANPTPARRGEKTTPLLSFDREVYSYAAEGRRDPFASLMATGDLRPLVSDLRLVAVAYDPAGASVAVLRDIDTNEQHRVRVGQQLGRMRVASIQPKKVVFTIEEFGFSRQETLALGDLTNARTQQ